MNLYEKERNGTQYRTPQSKFVVSRWYIPGGCEYDQAKALHIFFDTEEDAQAYATEFQYPPEMADYYPISKYETIIANCCRGYREYKKRHHADFRKGVTS